MFKNSGDHQLPDDENYSFLTVRKILPVFFVYKTKRVSLDKTKPYKGVGPSSFYKTDGCLGLLELVKSLITGSQFFQGHANRSFSCLQM